MARSPDCARFDGFLGHEHVIVQPWISQRLRAGTFQGFCAVGNGQGARGLSVVLGPFAALGVPLALLAAVAFLPLLFLAAGLLAVFVVVAVFRVAAFFAAGALAAGFAAAFFVTAVFLAAVAAVFPVAPSLVFDAWVDAALLDFATAFLAVGAFFVAVFWSVTFLLVVAMQFLSVVASGQRGACALAPAGGMVVPDDAAGIGRECGLLSQR